MSKKRNLRNNISRREFIRLSGGLVGVYFLSSCGVSETQEPIEEAPPDVEGLAYKGELEIWDWEYPAREEVVNELIESWLAKNPDNPIKTNAL